MIYFTEVKLYSSKKDALSVSIQGQGPGIPDDELEQIFDEFVQSGKTERGAGGTDLGLSISREIIVRHGGAIKASNCIGESGVVFTLTLPYKLTASAD